MKITKDELLIRLAKLMFYVDPGNSVAGDLDFLHRLKVEFGEVKAIYDSLWKDELEIEGYERTGWTKFDPDDPKTPLDKFERVLFSMDGVIMCGTMQDILTAKRRGAEQIYWRPLPNPPGKGASNETK